VGEVVSQSDLILRRAEWKRNGRRVVLVAGAFDLLHPGHVRLLEQARAFGDILVVGVESDAAVKTTRPAGRPVTPSVERAEILAALAAVDFVIEFAAGSALATFIAQLSPDFVVEGSTEPAAAGPDAATPPGTKRIRIPLEPGYSTAALLQRIKQLRQSEQPEHQQHRQPNA
jgi:rfaE bifunctional protein nucleotidyltransferase chain/domain